MAPGNLAGGFSHAPEIRKMVSVSLDVTDEMAIADLCLQAMTATGEGDRRLPAVFGLLQR
ncbi:MAG: hypothetical protein ACOYEW_13140 [Anaerolineae bacterium]